MRTGIATLVLFLTAACATRAEVEQIVLSSNAAMVGPWVERPGNLQAAGWEEAVDRIERLIARHPDQTVLVNHLRVRQAMLLTVNRQAALATEIWQRVDPAELEGNARDRALYAVRAELVWAHRMLPPVQLLNVEERDVAARAIEKLRAQQGPEEVRDYLRIVAAEIAVKRANSMPQATAEDLDRVAELLASELKAFIAASPESAVRWADGTPEEKQDSLAGAKALAPMRNRVWFDEVVTLFIREARNIGRPLALGWTLSVTVTRDGEPVPDAVVSIESPRHAAHETRTDASGTAVIESLYPGAIEVRAVKGPAESSKTTRVRHGDTAVLDINLGE